MSMPKSRAYVSPPLFEDSYSDITYPTRARALHMEAKVMVEDREFIYRIRGISNIKANNCLGYRVELS